MSMISRCLRSFFVAPPGRKLIAGDFSAVESRGTAWLAGEEWKLRAFRAADAKTGPGIYELTASKTLGIPLDQITKDSPARQTGKVQELAFGYQGGVGAARKFLPASMQHLEDAQLNAWKLAWRRAHPAIAGKETVGQSGRTYWKGGLWRDLEDAAIMAVDNPGIAYSAGFPGRGVQFKKAGSFLWCQLPSKRVMCYPYPKLLPGQYRPQLTYMTVPGEDDARRGNIIEDVKNANNWARVSTYGGSLTENIVQALCRDLLVDVMLTLHEKGAQIVLHVHDEVLIEVAEKSAEDAHKAMEAVMRTPPDWAKDFPLWAECKIMQRYGK
jgi:DNA polymerase